MSRLVEADRAALAELLPLVRRVVGLDARAVVRFRLGAGTATAFARLPFGVLVARSVSAAHDGPALDVTVAGEEVISWLDGVRPEPPADRDADWRGAAPPSSGWRRIDAVPEEVVRGLVRSGALALKDAAAREGVPGAQPRAEVADALLDAVVLTVSDDAGTSVPVTLRTVSALTRMGFLPRGGMAVVDVAGRWSRLAGGYGTVLVEPTGLGLL